MIRDKNTKALLNVDKEALNKYKAERIQMRKMEQLLSELDQVRQTVKRVCERIETLEKEYNGKTINR